MLYAIVEAESHDAVAKTFEGHPHLQIPQASIGATAVLLMRKVFVHHGAWAETIVVMAS